MHADEAFTLHDLAGATGIGKGFTSRIVRRLEEQGLLARDENGAVHLRDHGTMLDAWREVYSLSGHDIIRGHVAARSSDHVLRQLASGFDRVELQHAATGLAGAWLWTQFAGFRLVTFYVDQAPDEQLRRDVGFHEEESGSNVWLIVPNDAGVFHGASRREGVMCVHPVQVYLDLKDHPERSAGAAEHLRAELLTRSSDA